MAVDSTVALLRYVLLRYASITKVARLRSEVRKSYLVADFFSAEV